jgi:hypothetical protein
MARRGCIIAARIAAAIRCRLEFMKGPHMRVYSFSRRRNAVPQGDVLQGNLNRFRVSSYAL